MGQTYRHQIKTGATTMADSATVQSRANIPTTMLGGQRLAKDHPRVDAVGSLDELNVFLGAVRTGLPHDATVPGAIRTALDNELRVNQMCLIDVMEAVSKGKGASVPDAAALHRLEQSIASMERTLKPAPSAILPGGVPTTVRLHMCRSICDRAERSIVALARQEAVSQELLRYIERLSVWLLAAARVVAAGTDMEWFYG
jgi:cob(I)alamin adenosyltransferase